MIIEFKRSAKLPNGISRIFYVEKDRYADACSHSNLFTGRMNMKHEVGHVPI